MKFPTLLLLALLGLGLPATGQPSGFSDDFETDEVGKVPAKWDRASDGKTGHVRIESGDKPFGPDNKFAHVHDVSSGGLSLITDTAGLESTVSTFSFDFFEPSGDSLDAPFMAGYTVSKGDINGKKGWRISLDDGEMDLHNKDASSQAYYSTDTAYRFYIVVNDTAETTEYQSPFNGKETLEPGELDVWYEEHDRSKFVFGGTSQFDPGDTLLRFGFRTFSTGDQRVYLDNVKITNGVDFNR